MRRKRRKRRRNSAGDGDDERIDTVADEPDRHGERRSGQCTSRHREVCRRGKERDCRPVDASTLL